MFFYLLAQGFPSRVSRKTGYPVPNPEPVGPGGSGTGTGPTKGLGPNVRTRLQVVPIPGSKILDPLPSGYPVNLDT